MNYLPHQQRVIDEAKELNDRIDRLDAFLRSGELNDIKSDNEENLLYRQIYHMRLYLMTLNERIILWG